MKKTIISLGLIAACAFALTGCIKEEVATPSAEAEVSEGMPFEITLATAATKTAADEAFNVTWNEGDAINVFHAEAGSQVYVNDGKFTVKEAGAYGKFSGTLKEAIVGSKSYDWYVVYPYSADCTSPCGGKIMVKNKEGKTGTYEDLAGDAMPLWSNAKAVPATKNPVLQMHQLMAVVKLTFNNIDLPEVKTNNFLIKTSAGNYNNPAYQDIQMLGEFNIDITGDEAVLMPAQGVSYKHSTVHLNPQNQTIKPGESVTGYLTVAPCCIPAGTTLVMSPEGSSFVREVVLQKDLELQAGKIKEINVDLGTQYLSEEEAAEPVLFRFCMRGGLSSDAKIGDILNLETYHGRWLGLSGLGSSKRNAPKWYSVNDHYVFSSDANEDPIAKAYLSVDWAPMTPACANNSLRGYLPTTSVTEAGCSFTVNAKYAKLSAGTSVKFFTSMYINKTESIHTWEVTYSLDGGKTYQPANVSVATACGDAAEGNVAKFKAAGFNAACHPMVASCPVTADVEKASVIIKITSKTAGSGQIGFAPYYTYNAQEGLRTYALKGLLEGKAPLTEHIASMAGTVSGTTATVTEWGDPKDITGCAYLIVE